MFFGSGILARMEKGRYKHMLHCGLLQRVASNARSSKVGERGGRRSPYNLQGFILDKSLLPARHMLGSSDSQKGGKVTPHWLRTGHLPLLELPKISLSQGPPAENWK